MKVRIKKSRSLRPLLLVAIVLIAAVSAAFYFLQSPIVNRSIGLNLEPAGLSTEPETPTGFRIQIPSIKVDAEIVNVGLDEDGNMAVPSAGTITGTYKYGTPIGAKGNAVVAGHVNWYGGRAVFTDLNKLKNGDKIITTKENGRKYTYKVYDVKQYDPATAPLQKIFGESEDSNLNLVTCTGIWDSANRTYKQRLVVFSKLVEGETT